MKYAIRCPNCEMLIKKLNSASELPQEPFRCYACEEEITVSEEDLVPLRDKN